MESEPLSLRAIYEEHFHFVWKALNRLGVREADVPDAVQDVFIVVHRKLPEFEGRSKITTWLFGIAMRVAKDRQKLAFTRRVVGDEEAVMSCLDERADVAGDAERRQGLAMLEALLDTMSIDQRAVFTLFELEGMTGEAIAELLEIPLGTVYSRLRLAREVFQKGVARLRARESASRPASPPRAPSWSAPASTSRPPPPPRRSSIRALGTKQAPSANDEPPVSESIAIDELSFERGRGAMGGAA
ncbi:MAG: sigma-70 family RNA polymerase sigma factor [Polyangiaceae bacterium]